MAGCSQDFFKTLPKAELHAHLNGSLSNQTITDLIELKHQRTGCSQQLADAHKSIIAHGDSVTMTEVFKLFPLVQQLTDSAEAVEKATKDVIRDFAADGCKYLELRSTPRSCSETGMSKQDYIRAILSAMDKAEITTKYIVSIDRRQTVHVADETLAVVDKLRADFANLIVGIDLSGAPDFDGLVFIPVLERARRSGLGASLHLAETTENLAETIELLDHTDRIGHGTFLTSLPAAELKVTNKRIPIEVCLTSNIKTQTVSAYPDHHVGKWLQDNHPLAICTDDQGVFNTSLSHEYQMLTEHFPRSIMTREHLIDMAKSAFEIAFCSTEEKQNLIQQCFVGKFACSKSNI